LIGGGAILTNSSIHQIYTKLALKGITITQKGLKLPEKEELIKKGLKLQGIEGITTLRKRFQLLQGKD